MYINTTLCVRHVPMVTFIELHIFLLFSLLGYFLQYIYCAFPHRSHRQPDQNGQ